MEATTIKHSTRKEKMEENLLGDWEPTAKQAHGRCGLGRLLVHRMERPADHSGRLTSDLPLLFEPLPKLLLRPDGRILLLRPPLLLRATGGGGILQLRATVLVAGLLGRSHLRAGAARGDRNGHRGDRSAGARFGLLLRIFSLVD